MKEKDVFEKWCPMSRVVLQKKAAGDSIETIGIAYNRTTMNLLPGQDPILSGTAACIGTECAWWKGSAWNFMCYVPVIGYWWPRCGRCGRGT
ncbi:MAG: hypothetical protein GY710_13140 [Desulfobacteraceae bacterium]|nr:hypothetical protein [Desulfobacteraceae bacterium]